MNIGAYLYGRLEGVLQFGPSMDKRKLLGLVDGTKWEGFLELNRLAFSDRLPRNSESRVLGIVMRYFRKHRPGLDWIVSFADATQCGDGTIYRASGFVLSAIKRNSGTYRLPLPEDINRRWLRDAGLNKAEIRILEMWIESLMTRGEAEGRGSSVKTGGDLPGRPHIHKMSLEGKPPAAARLTGPVKNIMRKLSHGASTASRLFKLLGAEPAIGYQLRYLYFLNPAARDRLTVPILPFTKIAEMGATMYRGTRPAPVV